MSTQKSSFDAARKNFLSGLKTPITVPLWGLALGALFIGLLSFHVVFWAAILTGVFVFGIEYMGQEKLMKSAPSDLASDTPESNREHEQPKSQPVIKDNTQYEKDVFDNESPASRFSDL